MGRAYDLPKLIMKGIERAFTSLKRCKIGSDTKMYSLLHIGRNAVGSIVM